MDEELFEALDAMGLMDDDDDDEMGAPRRRGRSSKLAKFKRANIAPGVPRVSTKRQILGFPVIQFTNGGPTTVTVTVNPQKPVFIRKLVIDEIRQGPTAPSGGLVTIDEVSVGTVSQFASDDPVPAALFSPGTQENGVQFDQGEPGTTISVRVSISAAPAAGDTVDVSIGTTVDTIG
jgi:hypothetical protein